MTVNDDDLIRALHHMAAAGDDAVNPGAQARARAAMHAAIDAGASRSLAERVASRMTDAITARRFRAAGSAFAAGAAAVIAVGWSAPVGSPLHAIHVARENVALAVPGADRVSLTLGFAEERLHQAAGGQDAGAALDEAHRLLDDARAQLASHGTAADWSRWNGDESLLASLSSDPAATAAPGHPAEDSGPSTESQGGDASSSGGPGPSGSGGGGLASSGSRAGSSSTTTSSSTASTSTSSSTASTSTARSTTSGGSTGGSGSSEGSPGGSGSTSTQTSTTSGSGGGGPGPGSGGSSSSSTSSSSTTSH